MGELVIIRDGEEQNISHGSNLNDYLTFSTDSILPPTDRAPYTTTGNLVLAIPEPESVTLNLQGLVDDCTAPQKKIKGITEF